MTIESSTAPAEEPTTAPAEEPTTSAPAKEPTTSAPAEEPSSSAPAEEPSSSAPAEEPSSSEPAAEPAAAPVAQTANTDTSVSGNEQPADEPASAEPAPAPAPAPAPTPTPDAEKPSAEVSPAEKPADPKQENTTVTETTQETIPVTWTGDREYTPDQNSKVIYTAVLPEGYILADGVTLPSITVMVGRQARAARASAYEGGTYYFDLSAAGIVGTVNSALPDTTLHYVPFTYAGTVYAYSLAQKNQSSDNVHANDRSLFVSNYNISSKISWDDLNGRGLIFGKSFDNSNYKLRSLSVGNTWSRSQRGAAPETNEWDTILYKNINIKNFGAPSWGQDAFKNSKDNRIIRGGGYNRRV